MKDNDIELFIYRIKQIDESIAFICTNGACYGFAVLVQTYFPASEIYISEDKQHAIIKFKDEFYDINGKRSGEGFRPITEDEERECMGWSFKKNYYAGRVCENCGEIIE